MAVGDNNRLRAAWILTKVNLTRSERWVQLPPKSSFHAFEEWQPGRAVKVVRESIARETCPAMCMMVWATALRRSLPRSALCEDCGNLLPWPLVVAPLVVCSRSPFVRWGFLRPRQHTETGTGDPTPATKESLLRQLPRLRPEIWPEAGSSRHNRVFLAFHFQSPDRSRRLETMSPGNSQSAVRHAQRQRHSTEQFRAPAR